MWGVCQINKLVSRSTTALPKFTYKPGLSGNAIFAFEQHQLQTQIRTITPTCILEKQWHIHPSFGVSFWQWRAIQFLWVEIRFGQVINQETSDLLWTK